MRGAIALSVLLASTACGARTELPLAGSLGGGDGAGGGHGGTGPGGAGAGGSEDPGCPPPVGVVALATGSVGEHLADDATHVYWTTGLGGEVRRVRKCGGAQQVLASGEGDTQELVVDATHVYWIDRVPGGPLRRAPKAGGAAETVVTLEPGEVAEDIGVDATHLYWVNNRLQRAPKGGGPTELLEALENKAIDLAMDDDAVYVTDFLAINGVAKQPGGPAPSAIGTAIANAVEVDDAAIFWLSGFSAVDGRLERAPKIDTTMKVVLATDQLAPRTLALDATSVYWTNRDEAAVRKVGKDGTGAAVVAAGEPPFAGVAVDLGSVYWLSIPDASVMRAPK